ncbi:hypothetical protein BGZ96_009875 [Linnemannia gamsii]|uniref:Yeast cell wall synthesis Kre9/Knh1-like N-terminal domain-containing protein n=1 Tax=Linnemannia gamsii TaxID=64522 RepID=A0ABQ7JVV5_9FUNG|nr:hypothetical protein BGZ96_009875 [Linnemannia gamsii]
MRFSVLAVAASFISAAMAQVATQAYPTVPIASTVWNAGAAVTVQWKLGSPAPAAGLIVTLFKGDPAHQTKVIDLGTGAAGATSLKATLPKDLTSDWYSVRIGADSYSHYFLIKGTGPIPTVPAPTGVTATTSSAAVPSVTNTNSTVKPTTAPAPTTAPVATVNKNAAGFLNAAPVVVAAVAAAAAALVF